MNRTNTNQLSYVKSGLWIVITGLDGTGKTTLKDNLADFFESNGKSVKNFKFPYHKEILGLINNEIGGGQPLKDSYTDALAFMVDNRILGKSLIPQWRKTYDVLVSQRSYFDSFVHGECRGQEYEETERLLRPYDLERCTIMIHLNARAEIAYARICDDPDADKFETLDYIKEQEKATLRGYKEVTGGKNPHLRAFKGILNVYIDTSELTTEETFKIVLAKLYELGLIK